MTFPKLAMPLATLLFAATWACFAVEPAAKPGAEPAAEPAAKPTTESAKEPGVMLHEGMEFSGAGSYEVPSALQGVAPSAWPGDGWFRLVVGTDHVDVAPVAAPQGRLPAFLIPVVAQAASEQSSMPVDVPLPQLTEDQITAIYLRVPDAALHAGKVPSYIFKNGTSHLLPKLDYRYELTFNGRPLAFTVQNGLRGKNGAPYGEGAHYRIEYDGQTYDYDVRGFGWASIIEAITDLDGDGKPDFILSIEGNNSSVEAILLSSKAKPGKNPPTASLLANGC